MSVEFFKEGRIDVAKEMLAIIKNQEKLYRDGAYRYAEFWKENAILIIEDRCNTIIKENSIKETTHEKEK